MAPRNAPALAATPHAADSPRSSLSPPPSGTQGDLELELLGLANALYNLGTTVINDSTKEKDKPGGGKQVGLRVNDVVGYLSTLDEMAQHLQTMVPIQILADIDNSRNPMQLTRERLERAATENQFMNGKIAAIDSYRKHLDEALSQSFPELLPHLRGPSSTTADTSFETPGAISPEPTTMVSNAQAPANGHGA
jgi:mediator of RNA polymerase II transcription subunit 10